MKTLRQSLLALAAMVFVFAPALAKADASVTHSVVGAQGYDLVSYHTGERPQRGNGNHVATHKGVNYLFVNDENRDAFAENPEKYLPAYGGYCAFGVAVGKKFIADPEVWEVVDGKLYLNLDNKIKGLWSKDVPGYIKKADGNWKEIKEKKASDL